MAFKTLGIGGVLTFSTKAAVASMKGAHIAFTRLEASVNRLSPLVTRAAAATTRATNRIASGFVKATVAVMRFGRAAGRTFKRLAVQLKMLGAAAASATMAFRGLVLGAVPFAVVAGLGMKAAIGFEQQMSGVQAVLLKTKEEMEPLAREARRMGIISVFSAKQAGEAMENMARAGFNNKQIMTGLAGVMNAAAAEGIGLATATEIVANQVKAFDKDASEAAHVADVLALASARANTNIVGLGEGLKFVAPISRGMGVSLEDTTATLALLADSGLKGSLAGTAMKNALLKLAAPSGKGAKILKKLGMTVAKSNGDFVGMESILKQLKSGLNKTGGAVKRTAAAAQLFGLRGVAITNLLNRLDKAGSKGSLTFKELAEQLRTSSEMTDKAGKKIGAAALMADTRLDNVSGRVTLLKSSLESLGILTFQPLLGGVAGSIKNFTGSLNEVLLAIEDIRAVGVDAFREMTKKEEEAGGGMTTIYSIAMGVVDATEELKVSWDNFTTSIKNAGDAIAKYFGRDGLRTMTKMIIKGASIMTTLIPIALIVALIGFVLKSTLVPALKAVGLAARFAFTPMGLILILIIGFIIALKKENESLFDTFKRVWGGIKSFVAGVWDFLSKTVFAFFGGIFKRLGEIFKTVKEVFSAIGRVISSMFGWIFEDTGKTTGGMKRFFGDFGAFVGQVLIQVLRGIVHVFNAVDDFIHTARSFTQDAIANDHKKWVRFKLAMGRISKAEAVKEMIRINRIMGMTDKQRKQRAQFVKEREKELTALTDLSAAATDKVIAPTLASDRKIDVNLKNELTDKRTLEVNNTMCVDGRQVATASTRHQAEVHERGGFKKTPWNRRAVAEFGVLDLTPSGAGGS